MLEAPIPQDDAERVAVLRSLGLLDTPPEQRFNRITRTAARLFQVPMSTITLVDEKRQWFKSRFGLFIPEGPRSTSFCGHAIVRQDMLVVEDALEDERFADNPAVTGPPHVRFYAGRPLATPSGVKLGTLCLIGREPRAFGAEDRLMLDDLAGWAERELNISLELARMRGHLLAVMGEIVRGVIVMGAGEQVFWANASMEKLLGAQEGALNGQPLSQVMTELTAREMGEDAPSSGTDSRTREIEAMLRHRDGRILTCKATLISSIVDGERFATLLVRRAPQSR